MLENRKFETKILAFFAAMVTFLIIALCFESGNNLNDNQRFTENRNENSIRSSGSWDLTGTPIVINGNTDWAIKAASEPWCSGSGTWSDPYIIENVTINGLNASSCIAINNSDVYFIIQNSNLYNASEYTGNPSDNTYDAGIKLTDVTNGKLLNNNCSKNNWYGIYIKNGFNNSIIENNVSYNLFNGIELLHAENSLVRANEVNNNNRKGIEISYSYNSIIWGNTANFNEWGITVSNSDGSIVKNNIANNNGHYGIDLDSEHIDVQGNTANDNENGIYLSWKANNDIHNNTVSENMIGIYLWNSNNNKIYDNNASNNFFTGIKLYGFHSKSNNNEITNNYVNGNGNDGIWLDYNCHNNTISQNIALTNPGSGISLTHGNSFNFITDNKLYENNYGIALGNSFNNTILRNNASSNTWFGIDLYQSKNNTVLENVILDNGNMGIELYESDHNQVRETVSIGNFYGVYLYESDYNIVVDNNITENNHDGIHLGLSNNNTIASNYVMHNGISGAFKGIFLDVSHQNEILDNNIKENTDTGIFAALSDFNVFIGNTVSENLEDGFYLAQSNNNSVSKNVINFNQRFGLFLEAYSNYNNLTWNHIEGNARGIEMFSNSNNNLIYGNEVLKSDEEGFYMIDCIGNWLIRNVIANNTADGIYLSNCNDTVIHHNFFIGNSPNALDNGINNHWSLGTSGNYWDDYSGVDAEADGIGDTPYVISGTAGAQDDYPIYDDRAPLITFNLPLNGTYLDSRPSIEIIATDPNLDSIWYEVNNQKVFLSSGVSIQLDEDIWTGLPDGSFIIKIFANDLIGHVNDTFSVLLYKDTSAPIITINTPIENQEFGSEVPSFDIIVNDLSLDKIWYSIVNDGPTKHMILSTSGAIDESTWDSLEDGLITIRFYANDTLGHENYVELTVIKDTSIASTPSIPGFQLGIGLCVIILVSMIKLYRKKKIIK